jgi:putative hydrolase of the HAD superfamily
MWGYITLRSAGLYTMGREKSDNSRPDPIASLTPHDTIKAIIFDWGGVLCEETAKGLVAYFSQALKVAPEPLVTAFRPFLPAFPKGEISEDDLWQGMCAALGIERSYKRSLWGDALRAIYVPKKEMFALASRLKEKGYQVGLLSNAEMAAMEFFYGQGYAMFDAAVFSCAEGTRKPEQRIYEIALERLNVKAREAIFIDDRVDFIAGAQKLGIQTILFKDLEQVKRDLASFAISLA